MCPDSSRASAVICACHCRCEYWQTSGKRDASSKESWTVAAWTQGRNATCTSLLREPGRGCSVGDREHLDLDHVVRTGEAPHLDRCTGWNGAAEVTEMDIGM